MGWKAGAAADSFAVAGEFAEGTDGEVVDVGIATGALRGGSAAGGA